MSGLEEGLELYHLRRAVNLFGSQSEFAAACSDSHREIKQGHVATWLSRGKRAPADMVLRIERATNGKVNRHQLRPDVFGLTVEELFKQQVDSSAAAV